MKQPARFLRLGAIKNAFAQSLFFLPSMLVVTSLALSQLTVGIDRQLADDSLPLWFQSTVSSSRAILSAIAGGTITAASIVFSLTLVAVQLASSQFSPRVLRGFLGDRFQQIVMGTVVGTFGYSLLVLREVRDASAGTERAFLPQVSITVALVLALLSLIAVLASIDHTAKSLRVGSVADQIVANAMHTIDQIFVPRQSEQDAGLVVDAAGPSAAERRHGEDPPETARPLLAPRTGWVTGLRADALLAHLPKQSSMLIRAAVGGYVVEGTPIAHVWSDDSARPIDEATVSNLVDDLPRLVRIEDARTMQQDLAFGIVQLTDIALRGLSSGVNDPNTANEIVVRLGAIITTLYRHQPAADEMTDDDGRRIFRPTDPTHDDYVDLAFEPIRRHGREEPRVLVALVSTIGSIIEDARRRFGDVDVTALFEQIERIDQSSDALRTDEDRARVQRALAAVHRAHSTN